MSIEMLLTIAGVFISIASAFWAYLSAKAGQESLKLMRAEEELARPCIGESFWEVDFENEIAFCKLRFFPGRHFVQTKEALQKPPLPSRMEQKCSVRLFLTTPECAVFFSIQ